jgi:hypothetical protein
MKSSSTCKSSADKRFLVPTRHPMNRCSTDCDCIKNQICIKKKGYGDSPTYNKTNLHVSLFWPMVFKHTCIWVPQGSTTFVKKRRPGSTNVIKHQSRQPLAFLLVVHLPSRQLEEVVSKCTSSPSVVSKSSSVTYLTCQISSLVGSTLIIFLLLIHRNPVHMVVFTTLWLSGGSSLTQWPFRSCPSSIIPSLRFYHFFSSENMGLRRLGSSEYGLRRLEPHTTSNRRDDHSRSQTHGRRILLFTVL